MEITENGEGRAKVAVASELRDRLGAYRTFDGMVWPVPGDRLRNLEWTLRYGICDERDRFLAASVIAAYAQIIKDPSRKRESVIAQIKMGPNV